jgi:hypothetical protein
MSIVICLFTLETNGQKAKPVHRIRGEVYFVQNGDTTKEMRPYDISLIDKDGIHPVFFIKTEHKYAFTIELNQELLEKYTHIQVRMNERTGGSSIDCISESHIPLRNNTNLKFYFLFINPFSISIHFKIPLYISSIIIEENIPSHILFMKMVGQYLQSRMVIS